MPLTKAEQSNEFVKYLKQSTCGIDWSQKSQACGRSENILLGRVAIGRNRLSQLSVLSGKAEMVLFH